jgi:hypothetical protein
MECRRLVKCVERGHFNQARPVSRSVGQRWAEVLAHHEPRMRNGKRGPGQTNQHAVQMYAVKLSRGTDEMGSAMGVEYTFPLVLKSPSYEGFSVVLHVRWLSTPDFPRTPAFDLAYSRVRN